MRYPFSFQLDSFDCGPTCLKMVSKFYGLNISLEELRNKSYITREGVSLLGISQAAEEIGFRTLMAKVNTETLFSECPLPAILHWNQEHFVVLYRIKKRKSFRNSTPRYVFTVGDPATGIVNLNEDSFKKCWLPDGNEYGVALFLEPASNFSKDSDKSEQTNSGIRLLFKYLVPFKRQMTIITFYLLLSTCIAISFPYLTQNIMDKGILSKSYSLIILFSLAQIVLFISGTILDILRSWMLLHVNAKISLSIVSDFLRKLLKLPIHYFDSKSTGDISQRINDHHRIEKFLTGDVINTLFSVLQIIIFSFILLFYNLWIWLVFVVLSILAVLWIFLFQKRRKKLDYIRFAQSKNSQEKLFELVVGMQETKLFGSEDAKRWEWEFLQQRTYKLNIKSLILDQYSQNGFSFLSYLKNILISFIAAVAVIQDEITLGVMLSISFIIGQTNAPIQQLVTFFKSAQDANISLDRLQEIHQKENEENDNQLSIIDTNDSEVWHNNIYLNNVSFQYQGPRSQFVLKNISLTIPKGKVTAIVGTSGSGKTTLLKLLLGFYMPVDGNIRVGTEDLKSFDPKSWRSQCGTVMQDGYIFSDSITKNIALNNLNIDVFRMKSACSTALIDEFANQLPSGLNTKIGNNGIGLSGGQRQRILIARAVYKNPHYLFFDEATSSLDANNEKKIHENLQAFFIDKTVVLIAHRLSTVKNADQIIVLEKGEVVELGNHQSLTLKKGRYYELVKNQLELGS